MRLTGNGATHLAGKAIAVQYKSASFLGDAPGKGWLRLGGFQQVFAGFQIGTVIVRQDQKTFFSSQFAHTTRPLAGIARDGSQFRGVHNPPDVSQKVSP
jgi:hypothetical protein